MAPGSTARSTRGASVADLPSQRSMGTSKHLEEACVALARAFRGLATGLDGLPGLTLDFTKALDLLDPAVTREVLLHLGWGRAFVEVAVQVWQRQRRWIKYQSHTHLEQLAGPAMPQCDPLKPGRS